MPTVIDFSAARARILALAEHSIEIEAARIPLEIELRPAATLLERLAVAHGDHLPEFLQIAIEECKVMRYVRPLFAISVRAIEGSYLVRVKTAHGMTLEQLCVNRERIAAWLAAIPFER